MQILFAVLKSGFLLLGLITVLTGKFLRDKFILSPKAKYRITDEVNYVKSCRKVLYRLGIYYTLLGVMLLFMHNWPGFMMYLSTVIPALIVIFHFLYWHRYTEPMDK